MDKSTEKQQRFLQYAASPYAGIDGGDEEAEYWFVGMEWSAREDFAESFEKWQKCAESPYSKNVDITKGSWAFENRLNDIYKCLSHKVTGKRIFADGSNAFKLNLFPLSFKSQEEKDNWQSDAAAQQTGFASFAEYQKAVLPARRELFAELLKKNNKPKTIFCFGTGYLEYFAAAFGLAENAFIEQPTRLVRNYRFYAALSDNPLIKKIILCPFYYADADIEHIVSCAESAENQL